MSGLWVLFVNATRLHPQHPPYILYLCNLISFSPVAMPSARDNPSWTHPAHSLAAPPWQTDVRHLPYLPTAYGTTPQWPEINSNFPVVAIASVAWPLVFVAGSLRRRLGYHPMKRLVLARLPQSDPYTTKIQFNTVQTV